MIGVIGRRFTLVAIALTLSAFLLRGAVSTALVTRGDELAFGGGTGHAIDKYELAAMLDRSNWVAIDRFAFAAIRSHRASLLRKAVGMIGTHQRDISPELLMDRALCLHLLGEYASAARDFEIVGRLRHDARAMLFAGLDNRRVNDVARARALLTTAAAFEPRFAPAHEAYVRSLKW